MHISKPEQCLENINGAKNPRGRFLYRKQWCPLKEVTLFLVFPLFSYESRSQVLPPSLPPNPFAEQRIDIAADADEKETSGGWRCWLTWKKKRKLKFSYECLVGFSSSTTTQERHREASANVQIEHIGILLFPNCLTASPIDSLLIFHLSLLILRPTHPELPALEVL